VLAGLLLGAAIAEGALWMLRAALGSRFAPNELVPHPGRRTILCVGDSHTFGLGVQRELESFPVRLEVLLNGGDPNGEFAVENLGVPGANTAIVKAELERALAGGRFDLVIALAGYNDGWNLQQAAASERSRPRLLLPQLLRWIRFCLAGAARPADGLEQDERGLFVRHADGTRQYVNTDPASREGVYSGMELERRVEIGLQAIADVCRARETALLLQTYACGANDRFGAANEAARAAAGRAGVPLVDQARWFEEQRDVDPKLLFQPDGHPTDAGCLLMARAIHARLLQLAAAGKEPFQGWRLAPAGAPASTRAAPAGGDALSFEAIASDSAATLRFRVRGPAGGAWRLVLARGEAPAGGALGGKLGLALDDLFARSRGEIGLGGRFDGAGVGEAWVARGTIRSGASATSGGAAGGAAAPERVLAQLLLVDPYAPTLESMLLAASPVQAVDVAPR
jgi:lysophospholipase L1-like esterase